MGQSNEIVHFCTNEKGEYDFDISDSFKLVSILTSIASAFIQYKDTMIEYMLVTKDDHLNLTKFREGVEILTCFKEKPIPQIKILCLGISNMLMEFRLIKEFEKEYASWFKILVETLEIQKKDEAEKLREEVSDNECVFLENELDEDNNMEE